ncbi:MAG TPA: UPF0182 family protein [Egicoccus sp.]|nr:UPF0182 family protein [Egicoccus sp.]HSK23562.1 UPF0182 family protein [Egicoccus sp.]
MGDLVRRRLGTLVVLGVLFVLFSANRIAVLVTDLWWFGARGYREIFTTILFTRFGLGIGFGLLLAALIAANLMLARRLRPFYIPSTPQQAQIQRYRELADPYLPWLIAGIAAIFGFTSGAAVSAQWESFLLWMNGGTVGTTDPQFGIDLGFYLFDLPFLSFIQTWLFTSLILTAMLTVGAHYLLGGIRPEAEGEKLLPAVRVHLFVILAVILAVRGWGYWLDRYQLLYSPRGTVTGASYTDVNAELPALYLLLGVTVIAILLVLYATRQRGFLLPGAAVGLLLVASIILQGAYPAAIQRLRVDPQELNREREYIDRNLAATRDAFGLDEVSLDTFTIANDLNQQEVDDNQVTLRNIRLWDPGVLQTTYQELQALRPYYEFRDVAIDRYEIDGDLRQVMLGTRELSDLPESSDTWQNRHITYTHGFGLVASQVNTANEQGQPVFLAANIPPRGDDEVVPGEEAAIYFGSSPTPAYSLVRTEADELDFEDPETQEQVTTVYDGQGGVEINSLARRLAFALRFGDYNLVLTSLLDDDSRIIFNRQVRERVRSVAPFLELDSQPYPIVADGRIKWIVDAYTTSNHYPYAEQGILQTGDRQIPVNYVRNSVKVVVDAYDGDVTFYRVQDGDPVLDAWEQAFPGLISPATEASDALAAHFRYPQDLFWLQANLYTRYHIPTAEGFYNRADEWDIPPDAPAAVNRGADPNNLQAADTPLFPYYLLMRLPGAEEEEFVLIQPYLARERDNMVAWLAGRSDGEHLNELFAVRFPSDQLVLGPPQAQARIEQDEDISAYITLRDREGTSVIRGNLQVLPIADSLLYVEPIFLRSDNAEIPELAQVALVLGERTAFAPTFAEALADLLGVDVPDVIIEDEATDPDVDTGGEGEAGEEPDDDEVAVSESLLRDALEAFNRAQQALQDGDLAAYQREVDRVRSLLEQAAEAQGISVEELFSDEPTDAELLEDAQQSGGGADEAEDGTGTGDDAGTDDGTGDGNG